MSNPDENPSKQPDAASPAVPPAADVENQAPETGFGVSEIVRRWQREDQLNRRCLALRAAGLVFSLLAFLIMAFNKHGDWKDFDKYGEFRYVLAISILAMLYTGAQVLRQLHELSTGKFTFPPRKSAIIDFVGDQLLAYLMMSAASSAVPMTNRMREGSDNLFTDSLAASISMSFLAFFALALSSVIAGYKLSTQSYV